MEDADSDSDAEMADYGTSVRTFRTLWTDQNFDGHQGTQLRLWHSRIGNRIPRFPVLGGISRFPIPDSSWPGIGNREAASPAETARRRGRFPIRPGTSS
jgi:hypothetical protein